MSAPMATPDTAKRSRQHRASAGMCGSTAGPEVALIRERLAQLGDEKAALEARLAELEAARLAEQRGPQPRGPVTNHSAAREKIALFGVPTVTEQNRTLRDAFGTA